MEALDPSLLHAAYLPKPQLEFSRKVDNSNLPSKPRTLQRKYSPNEPSDPEASASTLSVK
jgi:exosome complex exonuclease RRP6